MKDMLESARHYRCRLLLWLLFRYAEG